MKIKVYILINMIIAGIIPAIFLYSLIRNSDGAYTSVKCIHEELLGANCPVCGMAEGFSAILRGRLNEAFSLQPNSIQVFVFLVVLFLLRITAILMLLKNRFSYRLILTTDIILSVGLFILTFKSIIPQVFYIYYKMLITGSAG